MTWVTLLLPKKAGFTRSEVLSSGPEVRERKPRGEETRNKRSMMQRQQTPLVGRKEKRRTDSRRMAQER